MIYRKCYTSNRRDTYVHMYVCTYISINLRQSNSRAHYGNYSNKNIHAAYKNRGHTAAQSPKLQWTGIVIFVMSSFIYPSKSSSLKDFENFPLQERELLSIHKICLGNNTKPYERI